MMLKGLVMDENISNLTCASGEISASSGATTLYSQQSFASTNRAPPPPPPKKKRSHPGNPDPDAEVIALSPRTLLVTNRFICEICNKGFQRDQNLQLHRRGHNLPWKLKKKTNKEVRKKVYICPEATCVHHDPSRALGDLTGIKKHFCRKHGEKKWKCEKCSKHYAVQCDWKAHSKICGTKEYRCDCGTLFSRRDCFITHRTFCDALAEESARAITLNPILSSHHQQQPPITSASHMINLQSLVKREQESHHLFNNHGQSPPNLDQFLNPSSNPNLTLPPFQRPTASLHMSATAMLQKAAQMGMNMSNQQVSSYPASSSGIMRPHQVHMSETTIGFNSTSTAGSALNLSSCEFAHGLSLYGNKAAVIVPPSSAPSLVHDKIGSLSSPPGFDDENFSGFLNPKKDDKFDETLSKSTDSQLKNDGLTKDFLGLKAFSHKDFVNIAGLSHMNSSSTYGHQN